MSEVLTLNNEAGYPADEVESLIRTLVETEAKLQTILAGKVDAVINPSTAEAHLLSHAQKALHESEERYRLLFETAIDAIIIADSEGRCLDANPSTEMLTGYIHAELLGRNLVDLLNLIPNATPEQRQIAMGEFTRLGRWSGESTVTCKDGSVRDVEFSATQMQPGQYQAIIREITARKRADEQVRFQAHLLDTIGTVLPKRCMAGLLAR
jgi:PAS domain S-box-containing protein